MQKESADIWKKNMMENLKNRSLEFTMVEEFFINPK